MRIILAHNHIKLTGGAEVFYHEVGRVLKENNHEVAFFSPADEGIESEWSDYFPKPVDYKNSNIIQGIINFKNIIYSKETKIKFQGLFDDFKPDIVHVFATQVRLTPSFLSIIKSNNVPLIMSCNDYKHICPNYKLFQNNSLCEACKGGKFYNATLNKCSKNSYKYSIASTLEAYMHDFLNIYRKNVDLFLFASDFMAKKTEEFWKGKPFKWDILKNPFDSSEYISEYIYEDYILYFGRLIEEKGVDILIRAMKSCPDVKLKIIGNGPQENFLKKLVDSENISNVEFLGPKWGDELNQYLKRCLCVVVPSLWHENFPYVILQSFSYAKAVIGTNRGGIPELVHNDRYGLIYDANSQKNLSEKILFANKNKNSIIEMGKNAENYIKSNFNDKVFYSKLLNIYNRFL
jgi:glycosyltransferase involved in cell wall biosynthesis